MIIGITGGIGSGKSTIARVLKARGFSIYDCDREAKRIITENAVVRKAIVDLLGKEAFMPSPKAPFTGVYNTAYVAQHVFEEPQLLERLNAIVHPAVKEDIQNHPFFSKGDGDKILVIESAILFDAGLDALCDKIIVVDAPEEIRIARTIARDYKGDASHANVNKVRARIEAQKGRYNIGLTSEASRTLVIQNDGEIPIEENVEKITQWMCKN